MHNCLLLLWRASLNEQLVDGHGISQLNVFRVLCLTVDALAAQRGHLVQLKTLFGAPAQVGEGVAVHAGEMGLRSTSISIVG